MRDSIIILLIVFTILILLFGYPNYFILKPYAKYEETLGRTPNEICSCLGIEYEYYPDGCYDCFTSYYCLGIVRNCKCLDKEKFKYIVAKIRRDRRDNNLTYDPKEELFNFGYDTC